jgi:hypothetical protein
MLGMKRKGCPRKRWINEVGQNPRTMAVRGWRTRARDWQELRRVTRETKVHPGL